jgi:tetraacyldisaccharide 4'-kinase
MSLADVMMTPQPWLAPLGALFAGAASLRAALYSTRVLSQTRLRGRVVSVGNLSVGGSGKTPIVSWLARMLAAEGHAVSVLSRGYGGSFAGECLIVADGTSVLADAGVAGDEPVMLARGLPGAIVAVGRRRGAVGLEVERRFGPRVHLLDDGFQHLRLARDLDIVCLAPADLHDRPLPAGRLRESRRALRRADVILLSRETTPGDTLRALVKDLGTERTFLTSRQVLGFFDASGAPADPPQRPFLLSGIARPERFVNDATSYVGEVAGQKSFPDHHRFTRRELQDLVTRARTRRADTIVTTEKDLIRLPFIPEAVPLRVLRVATTIDDEPRLRARVLAALPPAA